MRIPIQIGPASNWALDDYGQKWANSKAAAGGQAQLVLGTVPQNELWLIDMLRVSATPSDTAVNCRAYLCLNSEEYDVMGTSTGVYDVADMNSPIHAPGGSEILVVWRDMPNGAIGRAYAQWNVMRQSGGGY